MKHTTEISLAADPETVAAVLADLGTYPAWNSVVASVSPDGTDDSGDPAWLATLRAQVGPFARSKRLRLVRTERSTTDAGLRIRFERRELDGRDHAPWIMNAVVRRDGPETVVVLDLDYQGGLWSGMLDSVLGTAIDRATAALPAYLGYRDRA